MKKFLLLTWITALCGSAMAQAIQTGSVVFRGTVDTVYNGTQIMLYNRATNDFDSATIVQGSFEMSVPYKEPTRYLFYSQYEAKKKGGYAPYGVLVSAPAVISMKVDMENFSNTTVKGSADNDVYNTFSMADEAAAQKIMDELASRYSKEFIAHPDPKDARYQQVMADYKKLAEAARPAEVERLRKLVTEHPASFASIYILSTAVNTLGPDQSEEFFGKLTPAYKQSVYGKRITSNISAARITAIGKVAPEFEQTDTTGKLVKLTDFRGKYVLLDFWASWCGPCRMENPNVVKAFNQYKDKGFTVLGISLDQPGKKEAWINAIHKDNLTWSHVSDLKYWDNAVAKQYGIQAIPQNYLLDPQGRIVASNIRGEALAKKLQEIFSQGN